MLLSVSLHFLVIAFVVLLGVVFLLILTVLIYGLYQYRKQINMETWSGIIDTEMAEAIVHNDAPSTKPAVSDLAAKSAFRALFLEKLVAADRKFSGGAGHAIRSLFQNYGLEKEGLAKLKQKRTYLIAGGIQELTAMKAESALPVISGFLKHPSPQVYQEAQYAVVSFKGFEGLDFLEGAEGILSEWQQLRLLNSIPAVPPDADKKLRSWLQSENSSIIIFVLRLIRKYQLLNMYTDVSELLDHKETVVRLQAVPTMQALENANTLFDFQSAYGLQPEEVRIEILRAVRKMGDTRAADFYTEKLLGHESAGVRIQAAKGLCELDMEVELRKLAAKEDTSAELNLIILHALQEKI